MKFSSAIFFSIFIISNPVSAASNLATKGAVYLNAEPGSYVGGGIGKEEVTWTHGIEGIFSTSTNFDNGATIRFNDGHYWSFEFAAPTYDPITNTNDGNYLKTGFYDNATRFPFNSPTRPGLNFSGNGRGNNTLGGWFDVLEVEYGTNQISKLAVDFRQFDESEAMTGPSTFGSLRINSDLALNYSGMPVSAVPLPPSSWLFGSGLFALALVKRYKKAHSV